MEKNTEFIFHKYDGTPISNVNEYVKKWYSENPNGDIIIGCDSQEHSNYIKYAITVIMHKIDEHGIGHGAHVIYSTIKDYSKAAKSDLYTKLWLETEYTVEAAKLFDDCVKKPVIHLDYNSKDSEYSNVHYQSGIGYARGMGFKAKGKPDAWGASHTADAICKTKNFIKV
ncbi:MAG: ribonuclease H-like YkuK family protein [bacterium]